jgi:hypothetical protein
MLPAAQAGQLDPLPSCRHRPRQPKAAVRVLRLAGPFGLSLHSPGIGELESDSNGHASVLPHLSRLVPITKPIIDADSNDIGREGIVRIV